MGLSLGVSRGTGADAETAGGAVVSVRLRLGGRVPSGGGVEFSPQGGGGIFPLSPLSNQLL